MKIYTKTGDAGETSLFGGGRAPKTHPRVEACGAVDELNSLLGLARALHPSDRGDAWLAEPALSSGRRSGDAAACRIGLDHADRSQRHRVAGGND